MTSFMRQAAALFARAGWTLTPPETPAEKHARMCAECQKVIRDPAPISEQERRRHRWLVAREMRRAEAKRKGAGECGQG